MFEQNYLCSKSFSRLLEIAVICFTASNIIERSLLSIAQLLYYLFLWQKLQLFLWQGVMQLKRSLVISIIDFVCHFAFILQSTILCFAVYNIVENKHGQYCLFIITFIISQIAVVFFAINNRQSDSELLSIVYLLYFF